jgi:CheY-like chemotaxis protein
VPRVGFEPTLYGFLDHCLATDWATGAQGRPLGQSTRCQCTASGQFEGDADPLRAAASALKPDLVILDVKMPVLDGISAAEWVAAQQIAPLVILTAFS